METWSNFFVATAGAAATLTGLIFVGVSINLTKILATATMPGRAFLSLTVLLNVLVISCLCLVPGQSIFIIGIEFLSIGILAWAITLIMDLKILIKKDPAYRLYHFYKMIFTQFAMLPFIISGVVILTLGPSGVYWVIPGIFLSFLKAVIDAWVLLVEINR